eukprot:1844561-Karenia_brevis.AAC.1
MAADSDAGARFLEKEGMRALLPQEAHQAGEVAANVSSNIEEQVSIVTVNVDGLGAYPRSPAQR